MATYSEKIHDYRRVVILQGIIIVLGLTLNEVMQLCGLQNTGKIINLVFIIFGGVYLYLLWDMMRNFTRSKRLIDTTLGLIIGMFAVGSVVENPFVQIVEQRREVLFFIHTVLFAIEVLIISLAIRDIFTSRVLSISSLWGAACVYLMIGISFGSLYDIINIAHPGAFGIAIPIGFESYSESIYHSMCVLGGFSSVYSAPIKLVRNIGVIESVWCSLYLVLLIGRIFGMAGSSKQG